VTTLTFDAGAASLTQGRQRWYLTAFAALCGIVYVMAAMSPGGVAAEAVFLAAAQLAALTAGLMVYAGATESPVAVPAREAPAGPKLGREALRDSLTSLIKVADTSEGDVAVAVMLIEPDHGHPTRGTTHGFERVKLALRTNAGRAELIEVSESCLALTLAGYSASYELEQKAQTLMRELRDVRRNEIGLAPLNLTFGIGVCAGERSTVDALLWQARVALRRAYDLNTGIYTVSNRSSLSHRI
jgi:hypothetical protein